LIRGILIHHTKLTLTIARYFPDLYQGVPINGYTNMIDSMLNHPNIIVLLGTDYFQIKDKISNDAKVILTGPIDSYFTQSNLEQLEKRQIRFEE
jgi:UDP-galactopyranose mutase